MGIFDFVKEAGERIFDRDDDDRDRGERRERQQTPSSGKGTPQPRSKPSGSPTATATPTFEKVREEALRKQVERNGFDVQGLKIDVQGDRVVVYGRVPTQDVREKVILVVGNIAGVAQVDDRLEVERKEPQRQETPRPPGQGQQPSGQHGQQTSGRQSSGSDAARQQPGRDQSTFYTVKAGDTLSKIAQQHYGKASEYPRIFEANRPMLKDPDKIYPGQVLRIPAGD